MPSWTRCETRRSLLILAAMAAGCSPPGAVNEKAVLDSTPHSEPAPYAKSKEDYDNHMIERYTKGKASSLPRGKQARKR